jgi:acyl-coenzyme A thioesterase PaaI-like protein
MGVWDQELLNDDGYCFACGKNNPHGLQMRVDYEESDQSASCSLSLERRFQGWNGIAHGGVVSTLLDEIMAHAVLKHVGQGMTADMQTRYRAPVPLDQEIEVRGWVDQANRRLATAKSEIRLTGNGKVLAEAQARFLIRAR